MRVLIIEDEVETAREVVYCLKKLRPEYIISAVVDSVESTRNWFRDNAPPGLIISDIQLGDGLAFDFFRDSGVTVPVIFCTAFNHYAIEAFRHFGVDYILKPIREESLEKSLHKIESLARQLAAPRPPSWYDSLIARLEDRSRFKTSFLVNFRNKLIPISTQEIALFCITDDVVTIQTNVQRQYTVTESLDQIEQLIDPRDFFRANRQCIIARHSIHEIEYDTGRKLLVFLKVENIEPVTISKAKAATFLRWMESQ